MKIITITLILLLNSISYADSIGKYTDNRNGTVTDPQTQLMWMRCSVGQEWQGKTCVGSNQRYKHNTAKYLEVSFAGFNDWRLPTQAELRSIVECSTGEGGVNIKYCRNGSQKPAINKNAFPNPYKNYKDVLFWTTTLFESKYSLDEAWLINFKNGRDKRKQFSSRNSVRLVRNANDPKPQVNHHNNSQNKYRSRDTLEVHICFEGSQQYKNIKWNYEYLAYDYAKSIKTNLDDWYTNGGQPVANVKALLPVFEFLGFADDNDYRIGTFSERDFKKSYDNFEVSAKIYFTLTYDDIYIAYKDNEYNKIGVYSDSHISMNTDRHDTFKPINYVHFGSQYDAKRDAWFQDDSYKNMKRKFDRCVN